MRQSVAGLHRPIRPSSRQTSTRLNRDHLHDIGDDLGQVICALMTGLNISAWRNCRALLHSSCADSAGRSLLGCQLKRWPAAQARSASDAQAGCHSKSESIRNEITAWRQQKLRPRVRTLSCCSKHYVMLRLTETPANESSRGIWYASGSDQACATH